MDNDKKEPRRLGLLGKELEKYNVDIAAIQESRKEGQGHETHSGYTFFWIGKPEGRRDAGVAFAVRKEMAMKLTTLPRGINERLMTLRLPIGQDRFMTIVNVYAPTMTYSDEDKECFYQRLTEVVNAVPAADKLLVLGDFNARVGGDWRTYDGVIGKFGRGNKNSNGDLLLTFCAQNDLCITNTFFQQPDKNYYTWKHPRSKHWHLLDYVITRRNGLKEVTTTKVMRGAECSTDHYMIRTKLQVKPMLKRLKTAPKAPKKLNTSKLNIHAYQQELSSKLNSALQSRNQPAAPQPEETWKQIKDITYNVSNEVLGRPERKNADWFQDNDQEIQLLLEEKRRLHNAHLRANTAQTLAAFKDVKSKTQRELRRMKDDFWNKKAEELQGFADRHDMHGLFKAIKSVYGPRSNAVAPVKSADGSTLHTDIIDIRGRWKEHFCTLLNQDGAADPDACRYLSKRPTRDDLSGPFEMKELDTALKSLKNDKAPGQDGIPPEVLKHGGSELKSELLKLFNLCLEKGSLPQDMKDALIVTIYKKKGERSDCGNYRGISLLSIPGKILAKMILNRLLNLSEEVLPESQCGFRAGRSTTDMIFTIRQLQEKAIEQHVPLYIVFVDFSKAFDTVDRGTLWKVLETYGCPNDLVNLIREFHDGLTGSVSIGGEASESFKIGHGVKQGCVLAPTLFALYLTAVLETMSIDLLSGLYIRTRTDGKLYNLARLKSCRLTREECIRELLYADDSALLSNNLSEIQEIVDRFSSAASLFGLKINASKTELLFQPAPGTDTEQIQKPIVYVNGTALKTTDSFIYLGSAVTDSNSSDLEVDRRIMSASKAYGALHKRLWSRHDVRLDTKVNFYNKAILPSLLYSTECITLYRRHMKKLTRLQLRHLRSLLGIKPDDRIPDVKVLERAGTESVEAHITAAQLRWTGHVVRMPDHRLPKQAFYGELREGKRHQGGQLLRYKDVVKRHMKTCEIDVDTWEDQARDRKHWRSQVRKAKSAVEGKRLQEYEKAHTRRHTQPGQTAFVCINCGRSCRSNAGLVAHRRACR